MLRTCLALLFAAAAVLARPAAAAEFLQSIEDLPLMPGLSEQTDAGVSFPSSAGRLVEAVAHGAVQPAAVLQFYADALPQLGWAESAPGVFRREAEILKLGFEGGGSGTALTVRFSLSPKSP